jgi:hypothetical protein
MSNNIQFDHSEILNIAKQQKAVLWLIAVKLLLIFTNRLLILLDIHTYGVIIASLVATVIGLVMVYRFAKALKASPDWLYVVLFCIPFAGVVILLVLHSQATKALQARGVRVGLMGAYKSDLQKLTGPVVPIAQAPDRNEFKFSCPACGQHLVCDEACAGQQIPCPSCQGTITVPAPPPTIASPSPLRLAPSAVPAGVRRQTYASPPPVLPQTSQTGTRLCGLALVSVLLVAASPLIAMYQPASMQHIPITHVCLISGLICGHVALRRIRADQSLYGKLWAWIGLASGYGLILIITTSIGYIVAVQKGWIQPGQSRQQRPSFQNHPVQFSPMPRPGRTAGTPRQAGPSAAEPEPPAIAIKNNVSGKLAGQSFRCDRARLLGSMLELSQGTDFIPDTTVTVIGMPGGDPSGRTVIAPAPAGSFPPHVNLKWWENGRPRFSPVQGDFTLRLEFGQRSGNLIPGKIELEIPGAPAAKLSGEFTAEIR